MRGTGIRGRRDIVTTLLLPFLASLLLSIAATPLPASGEDVFVARSIEQYILKRSEGLRQRVDSISIKKADGVTEEGVYKSTWDVVVRFRLDYARPEEDPFLAGMMKCFSELKTSSDDQWIAWSQEEIAERREEIQEQMALAQESPDRVTAYAQIEETGYIDAQTIKLQVSGSEEALPIEDLLLEVTASSVYEAAGYKYLAEQEPTTGLATTTPPGQSPSGSTHASPSPDTTEAPPKPPTLSSAQSDHRRLMVWSVCVLILLIIALVASEIHNQRRR